MKIAGRILILVIAGLLSTPLQEVMGVLWMRAVPAGIDLTGNYLLSVVLPVVVCLHMLMAILLWKAFEPAPKLGGTIYVATHVLAQVALLTMLNNTPMEVISTGALVAGSGAAVMSAFTYYIWCPKCTAPPV